MRMNRTQIDEIKGNIHTLIEERESEFKQRITGIVTVREQVL